jgi:hypothetical protein
MPKGNALISLPLVSSFSENLLVLRQKPRRRSVIWACILNLKGPVKLKKIEEGNINFERPDDKNYGY